MLFISLFIIPVLRFVLTCKLIMRSYSSRPLFTVILNCRLVVRAAVQNNPYFYDGLVLFIDDVSLVCDITKTVWLY